MGGKVKKITAPERAELTIKALELLKAGVTYRQIAERLGIAAPTVHKYIKNALKDLANQQKDVAGEFRVLQLQRYQALLTPVYQRAITGDLSATDKARHILDSMNSLMGANAPTKIAPTDPTGTKQYNPDELTVEERRARIAELEKKLNK